MPILMSLVACKPNSTTIEVNNPLNLSRTEVVEIQLSKLPVNPTGQWLVSDEDGHEVESQVTSDSLLLFMASVEPKSSTTYVISIGEYAPHDTLATGRIYPERADDLAWENDNVAFRAYGPTTQRRGERGYGYDLFLKHGPVAPVVEQLYALEMVPGWQHAVDSLRREGLEAQADSMFNHHSYHVDTGLGMDCYAVGPTLGAGVAALLNDDGKFVYPWCYDYAEVLDQGPLRFRVRMLFAPVLIDGDTIVEERIITLDTGENLNHTVVKYHGLTSSRTIVSGVPLRDDAAYTADVKDGYLSYCDPAGQGDNPIEMRGNLFLGLAYAFTPDSIKVVVDADQPHLVGYTTYHPGDEYIYYWGYGWDKGNVPDYPTWNAHLSKLSLRSRHPLVVEWGVKK